MASVFDTFTGLPLHILVVHAVVVLVPLCFVGVCISAVSRTWRHRLAVPIVTLLGVSVIASGVAVLSGRQLRRRIGASPAIQHHAHLGTWVIWFVLLAFIATFIWLGFEHRAGIINPRGEPFAVDAPPSPTLRLTAMALALATCAFATGWVAYTGDAGSRATWRGIVQNTH